jgi:histidinol-phosphate/aromatic aminotransferase/cobyric acid decarboxylase-like protein
MNRARPAFAAILAFLPSAAAAQPRFERVVLDEAYIAYERDVGDNWVVVARHHSNPANRRTIWSSSCRC